MIVSDDHYRKMVEGILEDIIELGAFSGPVRESAFGLGRYL